MFTPLSHPLLTKLRVVENLYTHLTSFPLRFLSFLGIGENVSNCAFIMHTAQDTFVAHVLQAEPNAGPLCKTIEAACKLR